MLLSVLSQEEAWFEGVFALSIRLKDLQNLSDCFTGWKTEEELYWEKYYVYNVNII